ncbi:MAG: pyridoxamine 5-phosphate oxidase [Herminiimonas sp.]|jgi:hemerythrin-like domain-containing protein|nr:pyridoxamine 5-phosphate oxidase [Herminiimonas sp.]
MINSLFEPAPGFDQPIAVLKHCHDRIRKQLGTMQNLAVHLPQYGQNLDVQQAATAVLRYFNKAAHQHHEDEEHDLLPMLQATARGEDAALLNRLLPDILEEHRQMHVLWNSLDRQLKEIASGASAELSTEDVNRFSGMYEAHMEKEETQIAPMAKRLFSAAQMHRLGDAMRVRRGIASIGE